MGKQNIHAKEGYWDYSDEGFCRSARKKNPHTKNSRLFVCLTCSFRHEMLFGKVWTVTAQNWKEPFTHIEHRAEAVGQEGLVNWIPVLAPGYLLPSEWITILAPTFHFRNGPNTCSHCARLWHRTYPICDAPLWKSARRSLARSQKSRWNHCSYVWTEALSGIDCKTVGFFLKISQEIGKAWRKSLTRAKRASLGLTARVYLNTQKYGLFCSLYLVWFLCPRKSYPV